MYLLYLDDYHLDDPLFLSSMAQRMGRAERLLPPLLMIHGSGEQAERLLEANGLFPERKEGILDVHTPHERMLVERSIRHVNRRIVGTLTEEGIHTVGCHGVDRGLLRVDADGTVTTGRVEWVHELLSHRVVVVVSAMVGDTQVGYAREVSVASATRAMARTRDVSEVVVVFLTKTSHPGVVEAKSIRKACSLDAISTMVVYEPEVVRSVVMAGFRVLLTSPSGLFSGEEVGGTWILHPKTA